MPDLLDDFDLLPRTVTVTLPLSDADRAVLEHLLGYARSLNGHVVQGYETTCHGCGAKIAVKRRPVPGRHNWCETCTANGEPAAQRARDYRDRKREGQ